MKGIKLKSFEKNASYCQGDTNLPVLKLLTFFLLLCPTLGPIFIHPSLPDIVVFALFLPPSDLLAFCPGSTPRRTTFNLEGTLNIYIIHLLDKFETKARRSSVTYVRPHTVLVSLCSYFLA